jgi:uncharacterized protein (DUF58 family)
VKVSPLGWSVALAAVAGLLVGRLLGWTEAAAFGAAAGGVFVVSVAMTFGRARYAVTLELAERRVTVGERAVGRLVVANAAHLRALPSRLELPVGRSVADLAVPSLAPGVRHDDLFAVPTDRRSVVVVGPVRSWRGDPLGIARRTVRWTDPLDLYVHPRVVVLGAAGAGLLRDLEGQTARELSDTDLSFHALRDYVAGDDRRYIHWRTSARRGTLMVKQFEDTRRTLTAIALADAPADFAGDDDLELAVSVAASLGVQAIRDQREVTVVAGPGRMRVASPQALLDDCSAFATGTAGAGVHLLGRRVAREAPNASLAVLVTGAVPDEADLRLGAQHVPSGARTLVVRCAPGEPVAARTKGLLTLATLGALEDLPRLLRRAVLP